MRHVKASRSVGHSGHSISGRDAVGIGDAVDPPRHASAQRLQRTVAVDRASIHCALRRKMVGGCCHENVVSPKSNGRAIMGVKSLLFDSPCRSSITTHAKTFRRRRYYDVGPGWMCTDLMNIAIDIDSGPPG